MGRMVLGHVVWMDQYAGDVDTLWQASWDFEGGNHEGERSGERFLFTPHNDGLCYGYLAKWTPLSLERIDQAANGADSIDGVTVVWTATPPDGGDRVIVGWYRNATAYRDAIAAKQPDGKSDKFFFAAKQGDVTFLEPASRVFRIEVGRPSKGILGPGQSKVYYVSDNAPDLERKIAQYIGGKRGRIRPLPAIATPRQPDTETRLAVERESMKAIRQHLEYAGWACEDVSAKKVGWDITATKAGRRFCVEAKGLSSGYIAFELTPNEFGFFQRPPKGADYVVAVVSHALDRQRQDVHFFRRSTEAWLAFDLKTGRDSSPSLMFEVEQTVAARIRAIEPGE